MKIMKVIEILEFHKRVMKIIKIIEYHKRNYENHENLGIPPENQ